MPVGDHADVGDAEHQRVGIGVDREHGAGDAHADHVIELPTGADRHEQPRRDAATGDADLAGAGEPPGVGDFAGGAELGAQHLERGPKVVVAGAGEDPHAIARARGDGRDRGRRLVARQPRRQHADAHGHHLHR